MNIIFFSYCFVILVWFNLWGIQYRYWRNRPHLRKPLWTLFGAAGVIALAWFINNVWLSGLGMLIAITGVSLLFNMVQGKSQRLSRDRPTLLVWVVWCMLLSLTLAHVFVVWLY